MVVIITRKKIKKKTRQHGLRNRAYDIIQRDQKIDGPSERGRL